MRTCVAYGCKNSGTIPGVSYHRFPKNEEIREQWVSALQKPNFTVSKNSVLCSEHFREEAIDRTSLVCVRIRSGAVPSIFHIVPKYLKKKVHRYRRHTKRQTSNECDPHLEDQECSVDRAEWNEKLHGACVNSEESINIGAGEVGLEKEEGSSWVDISNLDCSVRNSPTERSSDTETASEHSVSSVVQITEVSHGLEREIMSRTDSSCEPQSSDISETSSVPAQENAKTAHSDPSVEELTDIFMKNVNPKTSERMIRKKKKMQSLRERTKQPKPTVHGPNGELVKTGVDLCDCLQADCEGCHFPCPRCRSTKCGIECRVNRKWYYEKLEVEGTNVSWCNYYMTGFG